ncbi:MAG: PA14 domain-containing protein [Pirellulaceae bacterium]
MPLAKFILAFLVVVVAGPAILSAADAHPRVIGFERFHSGEKGDVVFGGQLLLGELNCTSCHAADKSLDSYVQKKQAPVLDTVGSRVRPNYLLKFLADPQATKPGTTMPNVLAGLPESERKEKVEAIVHFLATTGTIAESAALRQSVNRGDNLYHNIGCLACHDPRKEDSPKEPLPTSIPIGTPSRKYTMPGLTQFLADPLAVRPAGRMPHLNLEPQDARDIASFLLKDLDISSGLQFALYEGSWDRLPDFSKLTPKEVGEAGGFDVGVTKKTENFALRFDGHINIPKAGNYLFLIGSDDGSRLYIDGKLVIDNDGVHPFQQKRKQMEITAGLHAVAVEYFEAGGQETLQVEYQAEGQPQQKLDTLIAAPPAKKTDKPEEGAFVVNNDLAAKGKEYFTTLGCASCHNLKKDGQQIVSKLTAPPLAQLKGTAGCLADAPAKTPLFALNAKQQAALAAALSDAKKPAHEPLVKEELVSRNLVRFNCVACHTRGQLGGVEEARNPHFKSDMPEMGDEGRLPPPLAGVGAKLRPEWMQTVFNEGAKDRPYMFTRMPKFGMANVGSLVTALDEADKATLKPLPKLNVDEEDKKFKAAGRRLVGGQAFGCIKCHTFAGRKSTGIQALSLTTMTKRLRPEWFHHYMQNPQAYRPGTRMPNVFPDGQTTLPMILDGSVDKQDRSMWAYLNDGDKAILPVGLVTGAIELIAYDEAIMYRNFIEGAGPRAIGVGYPEKLNLAFDANNLRLALIWQGAFIDAARHWEGRGAGFQPPLGDNVIKLTDGVPFAALENDKAPWPGMAAKEQGYRFLGYSLGVKRNPTFSYSLAEIKITDYPAPYGEADVYVFRRTLSLTSEKPAANLYFRAAAAGKIEDVGGGSYKIDGLWTMKIGSNQKPFVRENSGKQELLVPVRFDGKGASITQEFEW